MILSHLGGDPTGTGKGGMSIYGEAFDDEIHDDLKHTGNLNHFVLTSNCNNCFNAYKRIRYCANK